MGIRAERSNVYGPNTPQRRGEPVTAQQLTLHEQLKREAKRFLAGSAAGAGLIDGDASAVVAIPVTLSKTIHTLPLVTRSKDYEFVDPVVITKQGDIYLGANQYDVMVPMGELRTFVYEDLGLPKIVPRTISAEPLSVERVEPNTEQALQENLIKLPPPFVDIRRTLRNAKWRQMREGNKGQAIEIHDSDRVLVDTTLYDRQEEQGTGNDQRQLSQSRPQQSVFIIIGDTSRNDDTFAKYVPQGIGSWIKEILIERYGKTNFFTHLIANGTDVRETDNSLDLFRHEYVPDIRTSQAYALARGITEDYPNDAVIYVLHFSSGQNSGFDDKQYREEVKKLAKRAKIAYGEVAYGGSSRKSRNVERVITDPSVAVFTIRDKKDVGAQIPSLFPVEDMHYQI